MLHTVAGWCPHSHMKYRAFSIIMRSFMQIIRLRKQTTKKIRGRENITIGTWNVRTLNATGKVKELTYEMTRYNWHVTGLCEVRWKDFGETTTEEGHTEEGKTTRRHSAPARYWKRPERKWICRDDRRGKRGNQSQ